MNFSGHPEIKKRKESKVLSPIQEARVRAKELGGRIVSATGWHFESDKGVQVFSTLSEFMAVTGEKND